MKRTFLFVLVSLMVLSLGLAACGGSSAPASDAPMKIRVGTDATWPPFEYVDEGSKEIVGFDIDLMNAIADKAGIEVEYVNVAWDSLLAGMAQCQYDAAISAMTITEERKENFAFTEPYFAAGQVVTVAINDDSIASKDDLAGKVVGVQLGTTGEQAAQKIEGATVKDYDEVSQAFLDLMNGQIDAVIADNPLALGYVGQNPDKIKIVGEPFTDEYYGIAVCKTNTELLDKLNAALAEVQAEGVIDELSAKWLAGDK